MTITINGKPLKAHPNSVDSLFSEFSWLKAEASKLVIQPLQKFDNPQSRVLYVTQKEYVIVKKDDTHISWVGSDDATTCHVVVLVNQEESSVCVAHLDTARNSEELTRMVAASVGASHISPNFHLDLHIVGGYSDEENQSEKLTVALLRFFQQLPVEFRLQQLCVGSVNSRSSHQFGGINFPILYGLAVDIPNFTIHPAKFSVQVRGPCLPMRACRLFCHESSLYRLYHSKDGVIKIKAFSYQFPDRVSEWLMRSDDFIRRNFSTSPAVEPDHFAEEMRQMFQFVAQNPFPLESVFRSRQSLQFLLTDKGEWMEI